MTDQSRFGPAQQVTYHVDDVDRAIITCLLEDGRMSGAAIARVVGVSERTVSYRIAKLTRLGVIRVGAVVDHTGWGWRRSPTSLWRSPRVACAKSRSVSHDLKR